MEIDPTTKTVKVKALRRFFGADLLAETVTRQWIARVPAITRTVGGMTSKGHSACALLQKAFKGVSSLVAHKKGGFLGFLLNMTTARETNDLLRIFEHIFIQQ